LEEQVITDEVREEAALLCAVTASTRQWGLNYEARDLCSSNEAAKLALDAWRTAEATHDPRLPSFGNEWDRSWEIYFDICAEAEAMLRTGWTP
jgi:hypothetical protein